MKSRIGIREDLDGSFGLSIQHAKIEVIIPCESLQHAVDVYNVYTKEHKTLLEVQMSFLTRRNN